jgi:ATP-dependent DNA helicase RecG
MTQHELEVICRNGEGQEVEFKRNVNSDLSKELVAFANAQGGRIFIGIDDGGKVAGIDIDNEMKSRVEMMARDCDPAVVVKLEVFNNILIVEVPEGKDKPYRCTNGFYTRTGASSVKLSTDEIREFFIDEEKIQFDSLLVPTMTLPDDVDEKALKRFSLLSGISDIAGTRDLLINLEVLSNNKGLDVFNKAGALFFSKHPVRFVRHSPISCVLFKGTVRNYIIDRKFLEFDMLTNIDQAVAFLERNLRLAYEIKDIRRKEILEIPKDVLREAIINACAHRNYFEFGAHVVVEIFDDRVDISNPGGLPRDLKPEYFGKRSVARNPLIVSLLHRCNYIEKAGTGIQRMRDGMRNAGLRKPIFSFSGFFTVTFLKGSLEVQEQTEANNMVGEPEFGLSYSRLERLYTLLRQIRDNKVLDVNSIAEQLGTTTRTIRRDMELLEQFAWVTSTGTTNNKSYFITKLGSEKIDRPK